MPDVKLPRETWRRGKQCRFTVPPGIWSQHGRCEKATGHKGRHRGHTWTWMGPSEFQFGVREDGPEV